MRWFLLALIACTGCDVIFGLQRKPDDAAPDAAKAGDAGDLDAASALCDAPLLEDTFSIPPACEAWGAPTAAGASLALSEGMLVISLQASSDLAFGGCTHHALTPFNAGGIELHVPQVVDAADAYVVFHAYAADASTQVDASMLYQGSQLSLFAGSERTPRVMRAYDDSAMQWWRLRPAPDGKSVLAEYSPDGESYTELGAIAGTPPPEVKLNFGAGGSALTTATQARIDHVRVCGP